MELGNKYLWWQSGIVYQVYPRSFMDSDGDGVGDLEGIRSRLDYLQWLGVDAIWISPIFPSPMADFGYDVANYTDIHPLFGTLEQFDALLRDAHARGLRIILDFVPNHTSDQHPWFLESRSSKDSPKRDWYIWRDPAPDGGPPNNWRSVFGGPGWRLDADTGQYYYHAFLPQQPDLNWRNPEVQAAMFDSMRFWFDRGVDGFRVDVIYHVIKDDQFRDNPVNPHWESHHPEYDQLNAVYSTDRPEVHDIIAGMRKVVDSYGDDRLLIGEVYLPTERLMAYYGPDADGTHMPYNFQLLLLPWEARTIDAAITRYELALPKFGWPNWVLGNHDKPRVATRVGRQQARVTAMLLLTLRGTPTLYYGDEIGMQDGVIPPDRIQDPFEIREPGKGNGRDPQRTPMHWSSEAGAGFSTGDPWLPLAGDWQEVNVARQKEEPHSILALHRRLIKLRRQHPALSIGDYEPLRADGELFAFRRMAEGETFVTVLNLAATPDEFRTEGQIDGALQIVLSTLCDREGEEIRPGEPIRLRENEGLLLKVIE